MLTSDGVPSFETEVWLFRIEEPFVKMRGGRTLALVITQHQELWRRLARGQALRDLGLPQREGRIDLRGLVAPEVTSGRQVRIGGLEAEIIHGITEINKATWDGIDFSGARLHHLRLFDCSIRDCIFDGSSCKDWRAWGTTLSNTTFRSADLRDSSL